MKNKTLYIILGVVALVAMLAATSWKTILAAFLVNEEGFRANPYWDVSRWSWGYGTAAPGPTGTISRIDAMTELLSHAENDYSYLFPMITRPLNPWQWAALLSFSYNLGEGNADNLVSNINAGNDQALRSQWLLYNKADGVYNEDLAARRQAEFDNLWMHG